MNKLSSPFDADVLNAIAKALIRNGHNVAVAESVTAGLLQTAFSLMEGATDFFAGGITAYNINQKVKHLKVEPMHALACNAVSEKVAKEMAMHVAKLFGTDWGIGITGYASPIPEHDMKELYACFAISYREEWVQARTITTQPGDPFKVMQWYANEVLQQFSEMVAVPQ